MKKSLLIICVIATAMISSCGGAQPSKPVFKNSVDTVSYCFGMARTTGFIEYLAGQMGVDTMYMKDFVKGFMEGASVNRSNKAKNAYLAGLQIGQNECDIIGQIEQSIFGDNAEASLNKSNYLAGFIDGAKNNFAKFDRQAAASLADSLYEALAAEQQAIAESKKAEEFQANKEAGEKFIADKAKEDGVIALESGLLYKVIRQGNGATPTETSTVKAKYEGRLIDGTVFDGSEKNGNPDGIDFPVTGVIKGWTEILQIMPVGSKYQVYIPQELAYGEREMGEDIKPYSALEFDIELVDIVE